MFPTSSGHLAIRWKPRSRSFWKAGTTGTTRTTWPCWPSEAQRTSTSLGLGWAGNGWELLPWFWDVSFFGVLGILWFLWLLKYTEMMVTWNWRFPGGLATTAARILAAMWNLWSWGITPVPLSWLPQKSWGPMFASCHLSKRASSSLSVRPHYDPNHEANVEHLLCCHQFAGCINNKDARWWSPGIPWEAIWQKWLRPP